MPIASVNPATGKTLRTFTPASQEDLKAAVHQAAEIFRRYRRTPMRERAAHLLRAAEILEAEQQKLGMLMTSEMGKPLLAARQEAVKCASVCRYYASNGETFLSDEPVATSAARSCIRYEPIGPVLAVMPWNFPFWQVFRFAAPALMAGNVGLLKHASNVPQCALAIGDILRRAGFPKGSFQTLLTGADQIEWLIRQPEIKAVTLTGSTPAGAAVAATAARVIKKSVLELGGSDPFIVMPSASPQAVEIAVKARVINNGQSCIAAKRFIVHSSVYDRFAEQFVKKMEALRIGDPADESTEIGPLATAAIREELHALVGRTVSQGARILTGGNLIDGPGYYYQPTVIGDIPPGSPADTEEFFGPVALLYRVNDIEEAIILANATPFGLGSSVWTTDTAEQERFIDGIEAGSVFVNSMVVSDPRLPFGGIKQSGYGRELGMAGIREFVNLKAVSINS